MNRYFAAAALAVAGLASVLAAERYAAAGTPATRVLFIGNSYTFVNDLPATFRQLAEAGGHAVGAEAAVGPGWTLAQHLASAETVSKIRDGQWDYIVLQEQSQIPASAAAREAGMFPAARGLVGVVREVGATPVFFVTWARRDGWAEEGLADYAAMQVAINRGYLAIARELAAKAAPVGPAWARVIEAAPEIALWQEDGSHPTEAGTYLAACVFYGTLFGESPVGVAFEGELPNEVAAKLQEAAAVSAVGKGK